MADDLVGLPADVRALVERLPDGWTMHPIKILLAGDGTRDIGLWAADALLAAHREVDENERVYIVWRRRCYQAENERDRLVAALGHIATEGDGWCKQYAAEQLAGG